MRLPCRGSRERLIAKRRAGGARRATAGGILIDGAEVMKNLVRKIVPAVAAAGVLMLASAAAQADCVKKAGSGTGGNVDSAKFQAWEAVLQATDWGSWAAFMSAGGKVPTAPGYKVSDVRSSCKPGGMGQTCYMQAKLCK
jgi:hypothetical protein